MKRTATWQISILTLVLAFTYGTLDMQARRKHERPRPPVAVVVKPAPPVIIDNRYTPRERLNMALNYLSNHQYLTVKKYAKLVKLSEAAARAELNMWAANSRNRIAATLRGKDRVYVKIIPYRR